MKNRHGIILVFWGIMSLILLGSNSISHAEKSCNYAVPVSTAPGNSDYTKIKCNCSGGTPVIVASNATISPGGSITLHIDSGVTSCPTYSWSISGSGYSIIEIDERTYSLSCEGSTWGMEYDAIATITVTDGCGTEVIIKIRNNAGDWGTSQYDCNTSGIGSYNWYNTEGSRRYRLLIGEQGEGDTSACEGSGYGSQCISRGCNAWRINEHYLAVLVANNGGDFHCCACAGTSACDLVPDTCGESQVPIFIIDAAYQDWECP